MEKKKAIKIATATAIAASAITAVAPAQSEAATSLTSQIKTAQAAMKKPYDRYVKTEKLAAVKTVASDIAKAQKAQKDINAAIKKAKLSSKQKSAYYAQIKAYAKYISYAQGYVDAYQAATAARANLTDLYAALQTAIAAKDVAEVEKQYNALTAAIATAKQDIQDTVYGAKVEALLFAKFTAPTEAQVKVLEAQYQELVKAQQYAETLKAATAKVDAYVAATADLSTNDKVTAAKTAKTAINLTGLNATDTTALQTKIDAADAKVKTAEDALKAFEAEVSAGSLTQVTVKFNKAVDAVASTNFSIPGLTVVSATLAEDKKTVTLSVTGAEVAKTYELTVKDVKVNAQAQTEVKKSFATPTQAQLFNPTITFAKSVLNANGADSTLVTFTLKDAQGNVLKNAQNVEVALSSTFGSFGEKRVTVQNGVATALLSSEALTSDKTAQITAQVVEASDKNLIGLKATNTILMSPNPSTGTVTTGALMTEAEAYQADRVVVYFNQPVSVSDFTIASLTNKGQIDTSKAGITVTTNVNNDLTGGKVVGVRGLLPVAGNDKALVLVLDKADSNFPLVDNANVKVDFTDKRGSVAVPSTKVFKLTDARTPALLNVTREGLKTLKIEFSEAVDQATAETLANWTIDGKQLSDSSYGVAGTQATAKVGEFDPTTGTDTRNVVTVTLGKDASGNQIYLKSGAHSIQGSNIGDWAVKSDSKNVMNTQTLDFDVPVDTTAPTATVDVQSPEQYLVTFDKELNQQNLAGLLKLQKYNTTTSTWEDVADPAVTITNISTNKYLVETTKDWTQVYNTASTNKNYYNDSYRLHVDKEKVSSASNGVKNAEINLTLGGAMTSPDLLSPTIDTINTTTGAAEGTSYDVTMSEPVKLSAAANTEGITASQAQAGTIPTPTAEFIKKDKSVTVPATIATSFVGNEEKVLRVTPSKELEAGDWTLVVRSISDDVGNTAASATKDFTVVKAPTTQSSFKVTWATVDGDGTYDPAFGGTDPNNDYVFVKFNKAVALTGDFKNVLKTSNYTLNGAALPQGSQIIADIKGYDDVDQVVDSITIKLPEGAITNPNTTVLNISSYLESAVGDVISNPGEKKLPLNIGVTTSDVTVSTADELKAALANDTIRNIKLTADVTGNFDVNRIVNLDLNGKKIIGNLSAKTTEGGKITLGNTSVTPSTVTGSLTVDTPNADFIVGAGVTVAGTTTIKDVASSTFTNQGTLNGVVIQDANGSSFVNAANATVGTVTVDTKGNVKFTATSPIPLVQVIQPTTVQVVSGTITAINAQANVVLDNKGTVSNTYASTGVTVSKPDNTVVTTVTDVTAPVIQDASLNIGTATKDANGNYSVSLNGVVEPAALTTVNLKVDEAATGTISFNGTNAAVSLVKGDNAISVDSLLGSTNGIAITTLKNIIAKQGGSVTLTANLVDLAGNAKTVTITVSAQ